MNQYYQIGNNNSSSTNMNTTNNTNNRGANNTEATNAATNPTNAWDNDALENDDFDSDQLDEDESYSWASGITDNQDGLANVTTNTVNGINSSTSAANWRDWRTNDNLILFNANRRKPSSSTSTKQIPKLVDLCAKYVATNLPFELVESFPQPVPEDLQLKITHASFPDTVDTIRLYSCLANGHVDEYVRGEQLYNSGCVRKIIQIGFHLSAQVLLSNSTSNETALTTNRRLNDGLSVNNHTAVAIVCDRKRIISCSCTCSKQPVSWCAHIVAVCLFRILDAANVEYRTPVSESLSKLQRDQLQKFAQYLISELPQQILPTAQKLLDELLKSNETSINLLSGAPDPTAGASLNDISIWCMDEHVLQESIKKTLLKFIAPAPNVVSDVECLEHQSVTIIEYTSLLRPLRGREPEGMWNLISIIREMFRRRDKNSVSLLRLITNECLAIDQIIQLWFLIKASQLNHDKALFNSVTFSLNQRGGSNLNQSGANSSANNGCSTQPVHQACSSMMDEIVSLWKIACLDPNLNDPEEKLAHKEQLLHWHNAVFERLRKFFTNILNSNSNSGSGNLWSSASSSSASSSNYEKLLKRLDMDLFLGFSPAVAACEMTWTEFDLELMAVFRQQAIRMLPSSQTSPVLTETSGLESAVVSEASGTVVSDKIGNLSTAPEKQTTKTDLIKHLYSFDYDPAKLKELTQASSKEDDLISKKFKSSSASATLNKEDIRLDLLFSRCEALFAHGFSEQACVLAEVLAEYLLSNTGASLFNMSEATEPKPSTEKPANNLRQKCVNSFHGTVLWRSYLLCYILAESSQQAGNKYNDLISTDLGAAEENDTTSQAIATSKLNKLAFRIGLFGLETPRLPAISKALEVKLLNQEQELVNLLKRLQIGTYELSLLRDRAAKLRDIGPNYIQLQRNTGYTINFYSLPAMLGSFIFEVLHNQSSSSSAEDQQLAFESSLALLGMKANISESQHPLLCEGIRRHKGDLALTLLLTFKDDEQRLLKIIDKILDRDVHALFKQTSTLAFNPFNPNFKRIQQQQLHEFHQLGLDQQKYASAASPSPLAAPSSDAAKQTQTQSSAVSDKPPARQANHPSVASSRYHSNKPNSAIDSLSSGWEESENESPNLSGDVNLLETKYKCMSLRQVQSQSQQSQSSQEQQQLQQTQAQAQIGNEATSSDNSPTTSRKPLPINPKPTRKSSNFDDSGDDSGESSSGPENSTKLNAQSNKIELSASENTKPAESVLGAVDLSNSKLPASFNLATSFKATTSSKLNYATLVNQISSSSTTGKLYNQPSDALLQFMFEFSKTVLCKAGGSASTSLFSNNQMHQGGGIHRNLRICSILIALYALGLQNYLNSSWANRTYIGNIGTFVGDQTAEIGFPAICIMIECWQSHFTPSECAKLADRVSRGRDSMAVKAAAELALSTLRFANVMELNEIQRALIQCKEQSAEMLQRGCILVEHAVKDATSSNLLEILFTVAKRWDELFLESNKQQSPAGLSFQQNIPASFADAANFFNSQPASGLNQMNFQFDSFGSSQNRPNFVPPNSFQNHIMPMQPPLVGLASQNSAPNLQSLANQGVQSVQQAQPSANFSNLPMNMMHSGANSQSSPFLPMYMQAQVQQQPPPQAQNQAQVQPLAQLIQQNMFQAPNMGQFMPPPPNANQTVAVAAAVLASYMNTNQKNQANTQNNFQNANGMNLNQLNQMFSYQQFLMQQQQASQPPVQQLPMNLSENIDMVSMKHLASAFRVGILGLEALPKRLDGSHQIKYRQSPSYADDVKWLWEVAIKLDFYLKSNQSLQQFCQTAANVIQNPFLIQELVMDSANYLCRNNPNPNQIAMTLNLPFLSVLVTRCLHLYHRCCMSKLHHLTPNEHEDFINMLITARNIFYYSNNMNFFSDLIQSLRRSNKCKKEIWNKICNALNSQPIN